MPIPFQNPGSVKMPGEGLTDGLFPPYEAIRNRSMRNAIRPRKTRSGALERQSPESV